MLEEIEFPLLAKLSRLMAILVVALLLRSPVYSQRTDIRRVDFANFTYPWTADLIDPANSRKTFTLKAGKLPAAHDEKGHVDEMGVYLQLVSYGDVTGDGLEEAILSMSIQTGGSAIPGLVYVCTLRNNRPRLLWFFSTGDRAEGGLRAIYPQDGRLVLELKSPVGARGACCPTMFTRSHYEWRRGLFRQVRKETLPLPAPR